MPLSCHDVQGENKLLSFGKSNLQSGRRGSKQTGRGIVELLVFRQKNFTDLLTVCTLEYNDFDYFFEKMEPPTPDIDIKWESRVHL